MDFLYIYFIFFTLKQSLETLLKSVTFSSFENEHCDLGAFLSLKNLKNTCRKTF